MNLSGLGSLIECNNSHSEANLNIQRIVHIVSAQESGEDIEVHVPASRTRRRREVRKHVLIITTTCHENNLRKIVLLA